MYIERLSLTNFKNYASEDIELCDNVNCFVGNNGAGKTNLLDAVYYLSFSKSYFSPNDTQNIKQGEDFFAIHGHYCHGDERFMVSCVQKRGQSKQMRLDKKAYKSISDHIGKIPLVIITPSDQSLIIGGSELRRKFIDGVIAQTDKEFLGTLISYNKALDQRNHLLKQMYEERQFDEASLSLWDAQIVQYGSKLLQHRLSFITDFVPLFASYYADIAGSSETPMLKYVSKMSLQGDLANNLTEVLKESRKADRYLQFTTMGPHKDDIELSLDNMLVKRYGSQGQQKTFLLALKLAQFDYIEHHVNMKPILLLDDIFDKLDMPRVRHLIRLVGSDRFGQVLLSDTQPGRVQAIFDEMPNVGHLIYNVVNGVVEKG